MELTNPILHYELRQNLLSKRSAVTLWLFVAAMATVVWLAWPRTPKLAAQQILVSEHLFGLFWAGLYFTVATVAAAMSAVSITREKETGCFDLLCTTGLSTARLVVGKFLSVVGYLLLLVIASVPITAACYLMGGANWQSVGLEYLDLCAAVLLYGGIGVGCSVACERNHQALSAAFIITLPLAALSIGSQSAKHWIEAIGLVILLLNWHKILDRVRRPIEKNLPAVGHMHKIEITVDPNSAMDRILIPTRGSKPFRDDKNVVYEREWMEESGSEGRGWWHLLLRLNIGLAVVITVFLFFGRAWLEDFTHNTGRDYEAMLAQYANLAQMRLFDYVIIVAVLIGPALSANVLSKERERRTADLLMTTLLSPLTILFGKWRLSLRSSFHLLLLWILPLLPIVALIYFGKGKGANLAGLLQIGLYGVIVVSAMLVTLNTLGVCCSLLARSSAQALSTTYTVAVAWFIGPVILYKVLTTFSEVPSIAYSWLTHATPFLSFYAASGSTAFSKVVLYNDPALLTLEYVFLTIVVNVLLFIVMMLGFNRFWRKV